jgi:hypothetical protein
LWIKPKSCPLFGVFRRITPNITIDSRLQRRSEKEM